MKHLSFILLIILLPWTNNSSSQTADGLPLRLRIGTYNVGHFNQGSLGGFHGHKNQATAEIQNWKNWVSEQSLDILAVQEWNRYFDNDSLHHAEKSILHPFYKNVYFGSPNTWIYNGIATNYELKNVREINLGGQYYIVLGDLNVGSKTIVIGSVHVPWQEQWHDKALGQLIEELKKHEYFICMGDINAKDEEQLRFVETGFNMANGGHQGWFATKSDTLIKSGYKGKADVNIDNIITSPNIRIFNISSPKTGLNDLDHLPIIAEVVVTW